MLISQEMSLATTVNSETLLTELVNRASTKTATQSTTHRQPILTPEDGSPALSKTRLARSLKIKNVTSDTESTQDGLKTSTSLEMSLVTMENSETLHMAP